MYECLIKNARIIDGSGAESYTGTVAIDKDKIKIIPQGTTAEAKQEIDATGKVLCPGFIDAHTHGDMPLGQEFASFSKINQIHHVPLYGCAEAVQNLYSALCAT